MWQKSSLGGGFGKWICFQKSSVFIWKRYLLSLPAKELLLQEALLKTLSVNCEECEREAETIIHVLRDCEIAKKLWLDTGNMSCSSNFFNSDLCSWLKKNLIRCKDLVESTLPWEVFFAFGIWGLWMQKNKSFQPSYTK